MKHFKTNLLRNRRASTLPLEKLIVISLIIFAGFLILYFVLWSQPDASRNLCRASVTQLEYTKLAKTDSPFNLYCDTRTVEIKEGNDKVRHNKNRYTYSVESEQELAQVMSHEIAGCWWQFGAGDRNPFGAYANWGTNTRCVICSEISFDEKVAAGYSSVDIAQHMRENNYKPQDIPGVNIPYEDLLPFDTAVFPPLATTKDNVAQEYSVVFVMSQVHPLMRWLNLPRLWGCVNGALIGADAGAKLGATVGSIVPIKGTVIGGVVGGTVGGISGCFVGGALAGGAAETSYDYVAGDPSSDFKAYAYSFAKPKGDKDFQSSVLIVPSGSFEDQCDKLY